MVSFYSRSTTQEQSEARLSFPQQQQQRFVLEFELNFVIFTHEQDHVLSYVQLPQHTSVSQVPIFKTRLTTDIARVTIMLMELISVMAKKNPIKADFGVCLLEA